MTPGIMSCNNTARIIIIIIIIEVAGFTIINI